MNVTYDHANDLLYFRMDPRKQDLINQRLSDSLVLDLGEDGKIVGIEILDASAHVSLESILPINVDQIG
jgi:uncharacterized protein YuzE